MLAAVLDVLRALHEAQGNVVGLVRHGPVDDVIDLALVDDREVDLDARDVDVLLLAELGVVLDLPAAGFPRKSLSIGGLGWILSGQP